MAERRDSDPQFPDRSGGSLLRTAIAATPLTVGIAAALKGIHVEGSLKQPREAGIDQAMRTLGRQASRRGPPIPSIEDVNRFMQYSRTDVQRRAWAWATQSVDPFTRKQMLGLTEGIMNMTPAEARSAISATMAGQTSVAAGRIWQRFERNVGTLTAQATQFGLPNFVGVNQIQGLSPKATIAMATPIPAPFMSGIERVQAAMGGTGRQMFGITRPELAGEGLGAWNVIFEGTRVGDVRVQLPQVSGGMIAEGMALQTRRIAPDFVVMGEGGKLQRIGRTEMFLQELERGIAPEIGGRLKTQGDVERAIKQLRGRIFGELETTPANILESRTAAQAQREALRGMAVEMVAPVGVRRGGAEYRPGFRAMTDDEIRVAMGSAAGRELGLRGGVGPKGLAEGMLSTAEWERYALGPVDYSRRPEQIFREFQIAEESMKALGQKGSGYYRAVQAEGEALAYSNAVRPKLKAAYVDPRLMIGEQSFMQQQAMGEGETLFRARTGDKMIFEESVTQKLIRAREDIAGGGIRGGEVLGLTPEGKPFTLPEGAAITGVRRAAGEEVSVEILRRHQFAHGGKLFGGAKALALFREEQAFGGALRQLGIHDRNVDIIISMDELRKNRALHRRQMVDSLQGILERRGAPFTRAQARFMAAPGEAFAAQAFKGGAFSHRRFTERAMQFAVGMMDVTEREFGEAFGAVPYVMGGTAEKGGRGVVSAMLARAGLRGKALGTFEEALQRGTAMGLPEFAYGGPMLDVGGLGSVEPRVFDILKGGALGTAGGDVSEELMQRLAATSPETLIAHQELQKTLATMSGTAAPAGAAIFRQGENFQKFLERGGGVIRGAGQEIYVPGMDIMTQLRPYETHAGVTSRGRLSEIYGDIAAKVGQAEEGLISQEELTRQLGFQRDILRREFVPAGKGIGAVARGKVLGSRFLRGVSAQRVGGAATAIREANVVGITRENFLGMWNEMVETGLYKGDIEALEAMRTRFEKGGEIAGMLGRHPLLGEFSMQPVRMRMVEGRSNLIVLPEITKNVRVATEVGGAFEEKTLTLGPLVGLAGDKDADAYSTFLLGPRNEEALRKASMLQDSEYARRYTQHQVRMQLFKAGKAATGAETIPLKQMMAEVEKLSVGQKWIAPLSLEMTAAKRSLTKFGQGAAASDARFLLEWLEQAPISAKHMSALEAAEGGLQGLMMSITDAMQGRDAKTLEGNIATIVKDDTVAKAMLQGTVHLDAEGAKAISSATGTKMAQQIQGINVHSATREMMRSLNEADRTGFTRTAELLAGRGARAKQIEIAELSARTAFMGMQEAPGMMKKVATAYSTATNKMGALGAGLLRHHKAIGLGFAGTLALGAILSDPPKTVGSGRGKIPDARLNMNRRKAVNRMRPEDVHPGTKDVGSPTTPLVMRNQNVRLSMSPPSGGARVAARAPAGVDGTALASGFAGMGRNTSVNLRDNRSRLSPHEIASKLM